MKEQHTCTLASEYVVRVAGLPLTALQGLRFRRSLALIEELLQLERELHASGGQISEQLYTVIGGLAGPEQRRQRQQLIELRRAIFQARPPAAASMEPLLLGALPTELSAAITRWRVSLQRRAALEEEARRVFAEELTERRATLRALVGCERFLQGILLASRSLYLDSRRWLEAPAAEAAQYLDRKLEDGLLNYLTRMTAKTSPYSTFTGLARGHFARSESASHAPDDHSEPGRRHSVIEPNILLVRQIARELTQWPEIRPHLSVSVNPSLVSSATTLRFVSQDAAGHERLTTLAATPTLRALLHLVERLQPLTYDALLQALIALDRQGRAQELGNVLDQLIARGLLQLDFAIPDLAPDYLSRLIEALAPIDQERVKALRALLSELQRALDSYERASVVHQRDQTLQDLRWLLERIFAELGLSERSGFILPTKNLLYENTLLEAAPGGDLVPLEGDLLSDLGLLQELAGLYDPLLPGRIALAAFFTTRYGAEATVDLLTFYEDFYRESRQMVQPVEQNAEGASSGHGAPPTGTSAAQAMQLFTQLFASERFEQEELAEIMALRQKVARLFAGQPADDAGIRHIDRQQLRALLAERPASVELPRSLALYCQFYQQDGQRHLVLNSIQSGFGRHLRRLRYLESCTTPGHRERECETAGHAFNAFEEARLNEEEPLPIAIQGVFGSNLNLRLADEEPEIAYPGYVSTRPSGAALPLSDLLVRHDPTGQRLLLISRRLGRSLLPIHLGLMSDYWLPPLYRFLLWAFGEAPTERLWGLRLLDSSLMRSDALGEEQALYTPRTCLGRICINRAHWRLRQARLPRRQKGETHFDYFLKVQRWHAQYGLPARCFLRVNPFDFDASEGAYGPSYSLSKERKPVYLDFESYFSLSMFEHLIEKSSRGLLLEEALPGETDLLPTPEGAYVCEYVFEVNRGRISNHGHGRA